MIPERLHHLVTREDRRTQLRRLGDEGERVAVKYLRGCGYVIVATNVEVRLKPSPTGRPVIGEIDIIAYDGSTLAFVEVKSRRAATQWPAELAVDSRKRRLLIEAARRYRQIMGLHGEPYRFDVVVTTLEPGVAPRARLRKGYFSDAKRRHPTDGT